MVTNIFKLFQFFKASAIESRKPYDITIYLPIREIRKQLKKQKEKDYHSRGVKAHETGIDQSRAIAECETEIACLQDQIETQFEGIHRQLEQQKTSLQRNMNSLDEKHFIKRNMDDNKVYQIEKKTNGELEQKLRVNINSKENYLRELKIKKDQLISKFNVMWPTSSRIGKTWYYIWLMLFINMGLETSINWSPIQEVSEESDWLCIISAITLNFIQLTLTHFLGEAIFFNQRKSIILIGSALVASIFSIIVLRIVGGHSYLFSSLCILLSLISTYISWYVQPYKLQYRIDVTTKSIETLKLQLESLIESRKKLEEKYTEIAKVEFINHKHQFEEEVINIEGIQSINESQLSSFKKELATIKERANIEMSNGYKASQLYKKTDWFSKFKAASIFIVCLIMLGITSCKNEKQNVLTGLVSIDNTDSLTFVNGEEVKKNIHEVLNIDMNRVPDNGIRLYLGSIDGNSTMRLNEFNLAQAKPFPFNSKKKREKQFDNFIEKLDSTVTTIVNYHQTKSNSQIARNLSEGISTIRSKGIDSFSVLIISDMLIKQKNINFYQFIGNENSIIAKKDSLASVVIEDAGLDLTGVDIKVVSNVPKYPELGRASRILWKEIFIKANANSYSFSAN